MYGMWLTTKWLALYRDRAVRAEASNVKEYIMNNDKIIAIVTNEAPNTCPNCDSKELYGAYDTELKHPIGVCGCCGCLIYIKEDLTNENSIKSK
jgi:hypothetical protein